MQKSKNTKRSLLASILAMMLCVAMLVCSTFAWFTDSVTSANNQIVAGNLDVELYSVAKDGKETQVTEETKLFNEKALWEPGYTEVINLKVANKGTLALKYQLGVNVVDEKAGTNVADETFKLSDYIKFAVVDGKTEYESREEAIAAADATATLISELSVDNNGVLYPDGKGESSKYVTLIAYMPTTVGNEANYKKGTEAPEITLGVNLVATQTPYEKDSFDIDYDENAEYPVSSVDELKNAMTDGAAVVLTNDLDLSAAGYNKDNPFLVDADNVTINLNGKEIQSLNVALKVTGDDVTIKNGTIARPEGRDYSYGLKLNGANTTIENVTITSGINVSGYNPDDSVKENVSATIKDCHITLDCEYAYYAVCAQGEVSVVLDGCNITRTHAGKANYYFWVEKEFTDKLGHVNSSNMTLKNVSMSSTCDTALYIGIEPVIIND